MIVRRAHLLVRAFDVTLGVDLLILFAGDQTPEYSKYIVSVPILSSQKRQREDGQLLGAWGWSGGHRAAVESC